jgi:radical SAM superfamily enzyme YgiQ (UPF0313 family)
MEAVRALLVSTYDLGRQPLGLASPAAWLREAGVEVDCVDVSRTPLTDDQVCAADLVAMYLPMHTATRLALPILERVGRLNPGASVAAYGLYAPLNAAWLRQQGVDYVLGPDPEPDLVALCQGSVPAGARMEARRVRRFVQPDRSSLPPPTEYAALHMPDGSRRVAGSTDATRGCKHVCRHCPIVPVYRGTFRAVPLDAVFADIRAQVAAGVQHMTFGDPDFFNGPTHAQRLVQRLAREFPGLTYDVTIKVEHLLQHRDLLPLLRQTGCVMVTSAVESFDDQVLRKLKKGHSRADVERAVELSRDAGLALAPTFVPFTPWTTVESYRDMLEEIDRLHLVAAVAPVQLAIRLLVTADSELLDLSDLRALVEPFDPQSLMFPWHHPDPRVDDLQARVMQLVRAGVHASRAEVFDKIAELAFAGRSERPPVQGSDPVTVLPHLTEGWYCCAEPGPELFDLV